MDLLQTCAVGFHQLLTYQYHIVAGRKGRTIDFTISFDPSDFHHLAGLHKLTDNVRFLTGKRANIMQEILSGNLTLSHAQRMRTLGAFFRALSREVVLRHRRLLQRPAQPDALRAYIASDQKQILSHFIYSPTPIYYRCFLSSLLILQ